MFKKNFLDKENARFQQEVKHSERLLEEGESLMQACKHNIQQKDLKLRQLMETIQQKEEVLAAKQNEITEISTILSRNSESSSVKMQSYILNAKLKNTKHDLRRLRNEKLDLEATEAEYTRELEAMKLSICEMTRRNDKEQNQVKSLENVLGTISAKINDEIEKHSFVEHSETKLKKSLKREKETKELLLKEVNSKKRSGISRYQSSIDTKTVKPVDWNQIDDEASTTSKAKNT